MKPLPMKMRKPKRCKVLSGEDAWYYVSPRSVEVVAEANHNQLTTQVRLTRRQLERALAVMDEYSEEP